MKRLTWSAALACGALYGLIAAGAVSAETAAAGAKSLAPAAPAAGAADAQKAKGKKPAKPAPTVNVTVVNSRPANLVELQAAISGSDKMKKVLGALKPGKKAVAYMPRGKDCQVDVHGAFDDGQTMEATGLDICADKTLNLSD